VARTGRGHAHGGPGRGARGQHDPRGFRTGALESSSTGIDDAAVDEYFKAFAGEDRRRGQLELYRSGDFEELKPYEGCLAAMGVPSLLLWGENDPFAPVAGARRLEHELPGSRLRVMEGAGHFVWDDAGEEAAQELERFLTEQR